MLSKSHGFECLPNGWQVSCDGPGCHQSTATYDRRTSAVFEAVRRGWCRLGREWFCQDCAWDVAVCVTEPVHVPAEFGLDLANVPIAE